LDVGNYFLDLPENRYKQIDLLQNFQKKYCYFVQ
jgi:hypothetical protein